MYELGQVNIWQAHQNLSSTEVRMYELGQVNIGFHPIMGPVTLTVNKTSHTIPVNVFKLNMHIHTWNIVETNNKLMIQALICLTVLACLQRYHDNTLMDMLKKRQI